MNEGTRKDWPALAWSTTPAGSDQETPSLGDNPTNGPAWSSRSDGTIETRSSASRHSSWMETEVTAHRGVFIPASAKDRPTEAEADSQW